VRLYQFKIYLLKRFAEFWYWLMTPLAWYYSSEKEKIRYKKKNEKITEEQAVKWIAEDIIRYLVRNKKSTIDILICTYANDDYFWDECDLNGVAPYYIKRDNTKMAYYKFVKTLEFQEKIIDALKKNKLVEVVETVEVFSPWKRIENYVKTIEVRYKPR